MFKAKRLKHKLIALTTLGGILIMPIVSISCLPKNRPLWDKDINKGKTKPYNENYWNAHFDYPPISKNNNGNELEGDFENGFNISKDQLLRIRDTTEISLTDEGKNYTNQEMYNEMQKIFSNELLGNGIYHKPGRKSFEEIFKENAFFQKMFKATFADIKSILGKLYNPTKWEIRYSIIQRFQEEDALYYSFQFFHTDKNHIDRSIYEPIINRHDVGYGVGPKFIKKITGFKKA